MSTLEENNFDRYIYRNNQNSMSSYLGGDNSQSSGSGGSGSGASNGLQPGSNPVQGTLIQSSGSDNRVEINPDDHFYAYRDGNVVVSISRDGITGETGVFDELSVNNNFVYNGIDQPVVFTGIINSDGTSTDLPSGWSSSLLYHLL